METGVFKVIYQRWLSQAAHNHWQMLDAANSSASGSVNLWKVTRCTCTDK